MSSGFELYFGFTLDFPKIAKTTVCYPRSSSSSAIGNNLIEIQVNNQRGIFLDSADKTIATTRATWIKAMKIKMTEAIRIFPVILIISVKTTTMTMIVSTIIIWTRPRPEKIPTNQNRLHFLH